MAAEGSIVINIGQSDKTINLSVRNTRTTAVANMLSTEPFREKARTYFPLLYGLCPAAHLAAFDAAVARATGSFGSEEFLLQGSLQRKALQLEAILENIRVLSMEAARVMGHTFSKENGKTLGALRAELYDIIQNFSSLPIHEHDLRQKMRVLEGKLAPAAEELVFGESLPSVLAHNAVDELLACWVERTHERMPAAALLYELEQEKTLQFTADIFCLPHQAAEGNLALAQQIMDGAFAVPGFDLSPRINGHPLFTGTLSIRMNESFNTIKPSWLVAARLIRTALLLTPDFAPEETLFPLWTYSHEEGKALSFAITARGLLVHVVRLDKQGKLAELHIISPTEWHFAPGGTADRLLQAFAHAIHRTPEMENRAHLQTSINKVLFGVDACVPLVFTESKSGRTDNHA